MRRGATGLPRLGDLELAALEQLWRVGEADVLEVHDAVGRRKGISPNTVGSALERLHRKNLVGRAKLSHAYRYRPALSRDELIARRIAMEAGGPSRVSRSEFLSVFVDLVAQAGLGALDRLRSSIATRRRKRGDAPGPSL